ncbi:unnamed protein product, partial [Mesorhabditis spiculigera]
MSAGKQVFVVGGSGMTGKKIVELLCENPAFSRIVLFGRRTINLPSAPPHLEQKIVDFDKLSDNQGLFSGFDVGVCALGSTLKGSTREIYKKVDYDYVVATAKMAKNCDVKTFCLLSASSADEKSHFYYIKIKARDREKPSLGYTLLTNLLKPTMYFTARLQIQDTDIAKALITTSLNNSKKGTIPLDATQMKKIADGYNN